MRLPLFFVLATVGIDAMGIGLIMPVMPDLIRDVQGDSLAQAAIWGGVLATAFAVMQFLFSPTIGSISDRFGRRVVLLVSLGVMTLDYLAMAVAGTIWLLLAARIVGGITGATQSTAAAYMADISAPGKKAQNFGLVSAAFGVGFVFGPLVGGALGSFGPRAPFQAAAAIAAANFVFGYFILPETVTARTRRAFEWKRANPLGAFAAVSRLAGLGRLLTLFLIYEIAFFVYPAIWAYFTQAQFGWGPGMIGASLAAFGLAMVVVQGGLIRLIIPWLGEHRTVLIGLVLNALGFLAIGLVHSGWVAFALVPLISLGGIVGPALQGIMSRTVGDDAQGELQGVLASVGAVGMILSPLLMTQIFSYFTGPSAPLHLPGAPFLLSMVLMLVCLAIFTGRKRRKVVMPQ